MYQVFALKYLFLCIKFDLIYCEKDNFSGEKRPVFDAVNVPFSGNKRYVYLSETCPFPMFVKILYYHDAIYLSSFSISPENPYKTEMSLCSYLREFAYA